LPLPAGLYIAAHLRAILLYIFILHIEHLKSTLQDLSTYTTPTTMPHTDPSYRPIYTPSEITQYLDRISLPATYRTSPILTSISPSNPAASLPSALPLLSALIRYQIAAVPFENLDLHYSAHHSITLSPSSLFAKVVSRNAGRGGYCMENTCLLGTVLRSLGYNMMSTGARVNEAVQPASAAPDWEGPRYDGWNHMVNIVTVGEKEYLVDVGFGSNSPTFPVPLEEGYTQVNIDPGHSMRLRRGHIPDDESKKNGKAKQELWMYEIRFTGESPWLPAYCFGEVEFLPRDFEKMSFFVSKSPSSWFTFCVVALNYVMDPETERIIGDVTLFGNEIKMRKYGKSEVLMEIKGEGDRVLALEKYLGIRLTGEEREGIRGTSTELK
jgi:arylamine N-acetyltransferase